MFPTTSGSESMHHEHPEKKFAFLVESPESTSVSSESSTEQSSTAEIAYSTATNSMVQQAQPESKEAVSLSKEAVFLADIESCSLRSGPQNCDNGHDQEDEGTVDSRSPVYLATFDSISLTSNNTASRNHTSKPLPEIAQEPNDAGSANATPSVDDMSDTEESLHYALRRELRDADEEAKNSSMHEILEGETNFDIDDNCTIRSQSTFTVVPSDPSMVTSLFQYVGVSTICSCLTDFVFQASGVTSTTAPSGASTSTRRQKKRLLSPRERRAAMEAILFLWTIPLPGPIDMSGVQKAKAVSATAHKGRRTIDEEYVFGVTSLDGEEHDIDNNQYSHLEDPRKPLQSRISDLTSVSLGTHVCPLCSVHLDHAIQANGGDDPPPAQIHCPHCHQRMHRDCLVDWLEHLNHQKCPCCRHELISNQLLKQTVERNRQQRQKHGHTITTARSQQYSPIAIKGSHESSRQPTASPDKSQKSTVWDIDELSQAGTSPRGVGEEIIFQ